MPLTLTKLKRKFSRLRRSIKTARAPRSARPIKTSENQITLKGQSVPYTLRLNPRSKSIRLAIHAGGEFTVTAPPRISQKMIEHFIGLKADWILEKIEHFKKFDLARGAGSQTLTPRKTKAQQRAEYLALKDKALKIATEKVHHWNTFYNFKFNNISIKNQKTRWGSCSKNGNLNFNYKIALLPENLADYLVVHEIAHLGQFNHSAKFWALVAQTIPDYKTLRKELKGVK
ncbi:MAG: SprT family zinc-dependent metalloprotease [bacterium]